MICCIYSLTFSSVKLEDGTQHKNLRVFSSSTAEELISFSQKAQEGWDLQYTISESHAIRLVASEIQVYRPAEWVKGIVDKLKVEGATGVTLSPGLNPSVAVFVAEKKVCNTSLLLSVVQNPLPIRGLPPVSGYTDSQHSVEPRLAKSHSTRPTVPR